ncbi:hypothetical protein [Armatimonas rosea]|uniref:Uncharacterized protein n=1 Tax=Armatimonas rosea TaxID=685828 RepID=A0A7W9SW38_ARMRO|nr:hypothetical protein [Armatimonas rosea]MBB6053937.1 hypothetical protein [Armatimonas rosea]
MTLSEHQRQRRQGFNGVQQGLSTTSLFPMNGFRLSETTKETKYIDSGNRKRESSPLGEAGSSRSSSTAGEGKLLGEARLVFPARQKLYSVDVFGRRSEIDTGHMGAVAYQKLLDACKRPMYLDDPTSRLTATSQPAQELPEGCKVGRETGLPLPEWWELPEEGATSAELQVMIRTNLARASKEGRGIFRSWGIEK